MYIINIYTEAEAEIALRVQIDAKNFLPLFRQCSNQRCGGRCFANAALLIGDRNYLRQ